MQKLHFSIVINAPKEKIWQTTIGKDTYPLWTEVFSPGSNFEGSWEKGSKILFGALNENGEKEGMVSEIAENRPNEFLSIKHIGILKNGVEDTESPEAKKWTPAYENYTLKEVDGKTEFSVELDSTDEFADYFNSMWPKALEKLKEVAETGTSSTIAVMTWVKAPIEKVWEYYNSPEHITKWAFASDDWEAPQAENEVKVGGKLKITMAAKDGSAKFDLVGEYTNIKEHELLEYKMNDYRKVMVSFIPLGDMVQVTTVFDMEHENSREKQAEGWQAILNNFKKHVEAS
jgi:uncharacterized protein YndB with AHSA1/START domain